MGNLNHRIVGASRDKALAEAHPLVSETKGWWHWAAALGKSKTSSGVKGKRLRVACEVQNTRAVYLPSRLGIRPPPRDIAVRDRETDLFHVPSSASKGGSQVTEWVVSLETSQFI